MSGRPIQFLLGALCGAICMAVVVVGLTVIVPPDAVYEAAFDKEGASPQVTSVSATDRELQSGQDASTPNPGGQIATTRHSVSKPAFSVAAPSEWKRMTPTELQEMMDEHGDDRFTPMLGFAKADDDQVGMLIGAAGLRDGDPLAAMSMLNTTFKLLSRISWIWGNPMSLLQPAHQIDVQGLPAATMVARYGGEEGRVLSMTFLELDFDRLMIIQINNDGPAEIEAMENLVMSIRKG